MRMVIDYPDTAALVDKIQKVFPRYQGTK
jgi:hypothetical protein